MRKSYPRPNFVRKWLSLNGRGVYIDDNNEGLDKNILIKVHFIEN